jgi:glutaredoxin
LGSRQRWPARCLRREASGLPNGPVQESDVTNGIEVYGADWCRLTFAVREFLTRSRVAYDYRNIDEDSDARHFVISMNDGRCRFPMVVFEERILRNPTLAELDTLLADERVPARGRRP